MIKTIRLTLASLVAVFGFVAMTPATQVSAQNTQAICAGLNLTLDPSTGNCERGDPEGSLQSTIRSIINVLSAIVGIVAVIMIIVGGFRYVLSGGNDANVGAAKNTIIYAIVGLVIVAMAQVIVRFVLTSLE